MCCLSTGQLVESVNTWDGAFPELLFYIKSSGCNSGVECLLPKQNVSRPRHRTRLVGLSWRVAMLKSRTDTQPRPTAEEIIKDLFDMGYSEGDLHELVAATGAQRETPANGSAVAEISYPANTVHVYDTIPTHLTTITDAAEKHEVTRQAIYQWIEKGLIKEAGFVRAGDGGQRNVALLDCAAVQAFVDRRAELKLYDDLPPGRLTIDAAALKYGLNRHTLYMWVKRGHLTEAGRLKASARGGGVIVIDESELISRLDR